jgi:hypothetical protein
VPVQLWGGVSPASPGAAVGRGGPPAGRAECRASHASAERRRQASGPEAALQGVLSTLTHLGYSRRLHCRPRRKEGALRWQQQFGTRTAVSAPNGQLATRGRQRSDDAQAVNTTDVAGCRQRDNMRRATCNMQRAPRGNAKCGPSYQNCTDCRHCRHRTDYALHVDFVGYRIRVQNTR